MSKHTPGPWERRGKSVVVKGAPRRNNAYSGRICNVQGNGEGKTKINEIANANANLIAAAPQMLEALEELVELKDRRHSLPVEIYQESREKAWNKCRAAIAAAKGEV